MAASGVALSHGGVTHSTPGRATKRKRAAPGPALCSDSVRRCAWPYLTGAKFHCESLSVHTGCCSFSAQAVVTTALSARCNAVARTVFGQLLVNVVQHGASLRRHGGFDANAKASRHRPVVAGQQLGAFVPQRRVLAPLGIYTRGESTEKERKQNNNSCDARLCNTRSHHAGMRFFSLES